MPQLARPKQDYREPSEFGFGPGPVPRGKEAAPISEGGVYRAMCPPVELTRSHDLSVRAQETRWTPGDPPRLPRRAHRLSRAKHGPATRRSYVAFDAPWPRCPKRH